MYGRCTFLQVYLVTHSQNNVLFIACQHALGAIVFYHFYPSVCQTVCRRIHNKKLS